MAKFCGNCGTQLQDNAAFCPGCGTAITPQAPKEEPIKPPATPIPQQPIEKTQVFTPPQPAPVGASVKPQKAKKPANKKSIIIGIIAGLVAAVISFLVVSFLLGGSGGAKGTAKKVLTAVLNEEGDTLADMTSTAYYEFEYSDYDEEDLAEAYEDDIDDLMDYFSGEVGYSFNLSFEIGDCVEVGQEELKERVGDDYDKLLNYDIDSLATVNAKLIAEANGDTAESDVTIGLLKEGGSWKLADIYYDYY